MFIGNHNVPFRAIWVELQLSAENFCKFRDLLPVVGTWEAGHFVTGNYYRSILTRHLFATAKFLLTNNADLNR